LKKLLLVLSIAFSSLPGFAQEDTSLLYLRFPNIPPFRIIKVSDSTAFTKADLSTKKATMIMVFSPDCEHCQHETEELKKHAELFKKIQIVMVSPIDHRFIRQFYEDYKLSEYPNITIGRDPGYFLGTFYKVRSFPSIFLYDKKGNFVKKFDGSTPVEEIPAAL
jgi:thioredoxin-related protein